MAILHGDYTAIRPTTLTGDDWVLTGDMGLEVDGQLVICIAGGIVNGASIPRRLWRWLGHPLERANRVWCIPHDLIYSLGAVVVIRLQAIAMPARDAMANWEHLPGSVFRHSRDIRRDECDAWMRRTMAAVGEPAWKRAVCWGGVRAGGGIPWRAVRLALTA
jgi:hypothetical protein